MSFLYHEVIGNKSRLFIRISVKKLLYEIIDHKWADI